MSQAKPDSAYHHGDLPATLMDLALESIAREGTEKLSLRALARSAGVSATAPYRHFPTKRCLLAALATRGFRQLRAYNEANFDEGGTLEERFLSVGMGYIRFATENPTTYQIMFGSVIDDFSEYPDMAEAAEASYAPVLTMMEEAIAAHPGWDMTPERLGAITWSAVHGVASLLLFALSRRDVELKTGPMHSLVTLQEDPEQALRILSRGILHPGS